MKGILIGDLVGSAYEDKEVKGYSLPLLTPSSSLTDDSIIALATADAFLSGGETPTIYARFLRKWVSGHPNRGYGPFFEDWVRSDQAGAEDGQSHGNGAAVRAAVIGLLAESEADLLAHTRSAVRVTHSEDALELAQAVALAVFHARQGRPFDEIEGMLRERCFVSLKCDLHRLHKELEFSARIEETVAPALHIGLTASSSQQAMRQVLYIGGDTDTIGAIAGAVIDARGMSWPTELRVRVDREIEGLAYALQAKDVLRHIRPISLPTPEAP